MEDDYLIWSNEHRAWWGHAKRGYSPELHSAGRYTREEALKICVEAIYTAAHIGCISEIPVRVADVLGLLTVDDIVRARNEGTP